MLVLVDKGIFIEDVGASKGSVFAEWLFLLSAIGERTGKTGKSYLTLSLKDRTGELDGRMWDNFAGVATHCKAGCYVKVSGKVEEFGGRLQLILSAIETVPATEVEPHHFVPHTKNDIHAMDAEVRGVVEGFENVFLKRLVMSFLDAPRYRETFTQAPAAVKNHHAFIGGLLEHVRDLLRVAKAILPMYPEVNPDLLYTGIILHDFGKLDELSWKDGVFSYTTTGELLGHISIVTGQLRNRIQEVDMAAGREAAASGEAFKKFPPQLWMLLEHMLLSHHGRLEFGSPKLPMTPEAIVLSALDDLEAKFAKVRSEFTTKRAPGEMTERIYSMDNRRLLNSEVYLRAAGIAHRAVQETAEQGDGSAE
jgi:3'-5' exoribonuclease